MKDTWQCIKGLLCLRYREPFSTFARISFPFLGKTLGFDDGGGK